MYYLELTNQEISLLKNVLKYRVNELRDEISHTENHDYLQSLRVDLDSLEKVDDRVSILLEKDLKSDAV
jgi:hypothetical protein